MKDIIFKTDDYVFSYRVGGVHNGKILLQKVPNDDGYAFPGGHVTFGDQRVQRRIECRYKD